MNDSLNNPFEEVKPSNQIHKCKDGDRDAIRSFFEKVEKHLYKGHGLSRGELNYLHQSILRISEETSLDQAFSPHHKKPSHRESTERRAMKGDPDAINELNRQIKAIHFFREKVEMYRQSGLKNPKEQAYLDVEEKFYTTRDALKKWMQSYKKLDASYSESTET